LVFGYVFGKSFLVVLTWFVFKVYEEPIKDLWILHAQVETANEGELLVDLPPFLDVVDYAADNWLRGWFNGLPVQALAKGISTPRTVPQWSLMIEGVLRELHRVTRPGGVVAFEVGEVKKGAIKLDEVVLPLGEAAGFVTEAVLINTQRFTKTAQIWGVANNSGGTNSNRIVVFRKPV